MMEYLKSLDDFEVFRKTVERVIINNVMSSIVLESSSPNNKDLENDNLNENKFKSLINNFDKRFCSLDEQTK